MTHESRRSVLQETLQPLDVPSFIGETSGRLVWLNDAAKAAFGDRTGDFYSDVVAPEDVARVLAEIERMRSGAQRGAYEIDAILRDGRRQRVEINSVAIEGDAIFYGVFGVVLRPGSRLGAAAESPLTNRQHQVLELLASGHSTAQIADSLHLSRETIRNYVRDLLRALGAHSRIEAVAEGRRRGLI